MERRLRRLLGGHPLRGRRAGGPRQRDVQHRHAERRPARAAHPAPAAAALRPARARDLPRPPWTGYCAAPCSGRLEPAFAQAARELLEPLLARGGGDYAKEFALPYAAQCFAIFLGLPVEQVLEIRRIGVEYSFAIQEMDRARIMTASEELYAIARTIVADRRADPKDPDEDLVSSLLAASGDPERPIPPDLVVATVRQTVVAGIGAPHAVLGSAAVHLSRDPGLQDRLRADPALLPAAMEELLRLYAPYRVFARTALRDVELGGRTVRAGEPIAMIFPSANRDETVFDDADRLDLDRRPNRHLAFGRGPHRCPGAAMARMELAAALGELLAGTDRVEPDGEVEMFNWLEFGPKSAPLRLVPPHLTPGTPARGRPPRPSFPPPFRHPLAGFAHRLWRQPPMSAPFKTARILLAATLGAVVLAGSGTATASSPREPATARTTGGPGSGHPAHRPRGRRRPPWPHRLPSRRPEETAQGQPARDRLRQRRLRGEQPRRHHLPHRPGLPGVHRGGQRRRGRLPRPEHP
ncbi:cytochrome P450 [Nonomuraea salmonea]|uniref:cytochrome P450 n=1 Tax=Nonomuraea salmonea TaxID=46181 RepID=UPI002FEBBE63